MKERVMSARASASAMASPESSSRGEVAASHSGSEMFEDPALCNGGAEMSNGEMSSWKDLVWCLRLEDVSVGWVGMLVRRLSIDTVSAPVLALDVAASSLIWSVSRSRLAVIVVNLVSIAAVIEARRDVSIIDISTGAAATFPFWFPMTSSRELWSRSWS